MDIVVLKENTIFRVRDCGNQITVKLGSKELEAYLGFCRTGGVWFYPVAMHLKLGL